MDLSLIADLFNFRRADPSWLVWFLLIVGVNAVAFIIQVRQKARELDIDFFGKNATAYTHEHQRVGKNLPMAPNVVDSFIASRRVASRGRAPAVQISASPASVVPAPVPSTVVPVPSAVVPVPVASAPASGVPAPAPALPVVPADVVTPIDTLRIPLNRSNAVLFIGGYPDLGVASDQIAYRLAFLQVNGKQHMLGAFPAEQDEESVIRAGMKVANKRLTLILRQAVKEGRSSKAV